MAVVDVAGGQKSDPQEVIRFTTAVHSANVNRVVLADKRRRFRVINYGPNPVFVGTNGQDIEAANITTGGLPTEGILEVPAPGSGETQVAEEFFTAERVPAIFVKSETATSQVQIIAGN